MSVLMSTETKSASSPAGHQYQPDDGLLVLQDLTKKFGGLTAVDSLSFAITEGEIVGFIGPNGAGKSTTFNCIMGRHQPTSGRVYYDGEEITGLATHRLVKRGMARTFQEFRPFTDRNVVNNVMAALVPDRLFSLDGLRGKTREKAEALCERVGLGDRLYQMPDELPHAGMLRLELARALATDPELLLIDEPFAGLTETEVERISDLLLECREEGITLIVVDHNMRGLLDLIDRAFVINFGSKIAEGTPTEIRENTAVQDAYLGGEQ